MIQTARLILRPYNISDFDDYLNMVSDPMVAQFLGGQPMRAEDAWNRLLRYAGHWATFNFGMFAVVEQATNRFLGQTGIADFHRGLGSDFDGVGEAAWVFTSKSQGRGYAYEAGMAALKWYNSSEGRQRTVCLIAPDNRASLILAEKLGYIPFGNVVYRGGPFVTLERISTQG
ncbi:GNAT family N-acetyltransferase [Sphingomonas sp. CROZ-RG-20F-R02-07]|uniref:GNAT family N-acetyltransferase n=1 Tax=Sphingomonas sp. CROZ-RG-20F-R02-07 TaxID=2914832 RepID=UPI001F5A68C2|nr:GNAT family N-acetyltransferase [Sphingomonas sp. CROZ-RG-20F-R02-07]